MTDSNPPLFKREILELARMLRQLGLTWKRLITSRDDLPPEVRIRIENLATKYEQQDLEEEYATYARRFAFKEPKIPRSKQLALAKLDVELWYALIFLFYDGLYKKEWKESRFFHEHEELLGLLDKDDLLPIDKFQRRFDALVYHGDVVCPLYIDIDLVRLLFELADLDGINIRVAVDAWNVTKEPNYMQLVREERFWGKPFDKSELLEPLPEKVVEACFQRSISEQEVYERFLPPLERLEVMRTEKPECLSFMLEELVPLEDSYQRVGMVSTKMFHSEYDRSREVFRHTDGSLLIYSIENYQKRLKCKLSDKVKAEAHIKLFRIDGKLSYQDWSMSIQRFFHQNELIQEFLEGE